VERLDPLAEKEIKNFQACFGELKTGRMRKGKKYMRLAGPYKKG
jgi:hypothetical protein